MIITVANQKGGVGKTTTAVHLAHGLAMQGHQVTLIDTDPQGHCAICLGLEPAGDLHSVIAEHAPILNCLAKARQNLSVLRCDKTAEATVRFLNNTYNGINAFTFLAGLRGIVIIDTCPSLNILQLAAIASCHLLLIPTKCDHLAVAAVNATLASFAQLTIERLTHASAYAILPTMVDRTTVTTATYLADLLHNFPRAVMPVIPLDNKMRDLHGLTLYELFPQAKALNGWPGMSSGYNMVLDRINSLYPF